MVLRVVYTLSDCTGVAKIVGTTLIMLTCENQSKDYSEITRLISGHSGSGPIRVAGDSASDGPSLRAAVRKDNGPFRAAVAIDYILL